MYRAYLKSFVQTISQSIYVYSTRVSQTAPGSSKSEGRVVGAGLLSAPWRVNELLQFSLHTGPVFYLSLDLYYINKI